MADEQKMEALRDDLWNGMEKNLLDLYRLKETGLPASQRDVLFIQQVMCLVAGEVHLRRHRRGQ